MMTTLLKTATVIVVCGSLATSIHAAGQETVSAEQNLKLERSGNGNIRMLRGQRGPVPLQDLSLRPLHEKVAGQFAPRFGIQNPGQQLRVKKQTTKDSRTHIRYGQLHNGLPVIGGELVANLDEQNRLISMSGETSRVLLSDVTPTISAEQASETAIHAVAKWYQLNPDQLVASSPILSVYDPSLLINTVSSSSLVWQVNVAPDTIAPINEFILIDAKTGGISLHFNQVDTALNRQTYDAGNQFVLPGSLVCSEATVPCSYDADAAAAHNFAGNTYDFYFNTHGRDGIDGSGMVIRSTVHFGPASGTPGAIDNAFWLGDTPLLNSTNQMVYTDGFSQSDDVVAHELTHGVTDFTSQLLYFSESGAINESMSDLWGEFVDQTNGAGTDGAAVDWLMGEDLPLFGPIRDLSDPPDYGDPDRMTSNLFYVGSDDNGGVHFNSGVNNKAAYLMVDGSGAEPAGQFNGQTVAGMGIEKTAILYYRVQTSYLTSGSDYLDLYNALLAACTDLVGTGDLLPADCTDTVTPALTAVEMNQQPSASYAPSAEICQVGVNVYDLFFDNFDSNSIGNWSTNSPVGPNKWSTSTINLASNSGPYNVIGSGHDASGAPDDDSDSSLQTSVAFRSPASETLFIHFDHAFYFEQSPVADYDGGVVEYSLDNGSTWNDASGLIDSGRNYTGVLAAFNPQAGRDAFAGFSNGFNSTRLNLGSLAGQWVRFRFRVLSDESVESGPWTIDNFRIYMCTDNAPPIPNAGPDRDSPGDRSVTLSGSVEDPDGDPITIQWNQVGGTPVTLNNADTLTPSFITPKTTGTLTFELSATSNGVTETDEVEVTVNFFLNGNVNGGGSGCSLSDQGRFDPLWLLLLMALAGIHLKSRHRTRKADREQA